MGLVFQDFVRNFYRIEQTEYRVSSDSLAWAIERDVGHGHELFPSMQTDVSLRSKERTVVVECKWYREPLALSYGQPRIRADHLYQVFAYLKNLEARAGTPIPERRASCSIRKSARPLTWRVGSKPTHFAFDLWT